MSKSKLRTQVLHKGGAPFCLKSHSQCRGCFGWRNMLGAVHSDAVWQTHAIRCAATGLTLKIEREN